MKFLPLILSGIFLWGFAILDLATSSRDFSEIENRPLATAPSPTFRDILENSFQARYEQFTNDQFIGRDGWISLKSRAESALGKLENNGIVYGADGYMFEKVTAVDEERLERNIGFVEAFARNHPDKNLTFTIIPNSYAVLADKLPRGLNNIDQLAIIAGLYNRAEAAGWRVCDITPTLLASSDDYIYYRTDHHWTTLGARLALNAYLGSSPDHSAYQPSICVPDFYGTYYSRAKLHSAVPDVLTYYEIPIAGVTIGGLPVDGLYDFDKLSTRDKYAMLLHGNNGLTVIRSSSEHATGRILLFKDSFGNSLAPFLSDAFAEVYVADLRYLTEAQVDELVRETVFDQIWLLYNFSSFADDTHLAKLL